MSYKQSGTVFSSEISNAFASMLKCLYKFTCSCDTNLTYICVILEKAQLKITCCFAAPGLIYNTTHILRNCNSDYDAKIEEALLVKRHSFSLDKQCCASGTSFLLNIY